MWLGGIAPVELRRVGRLADGWLPSLVTASEAAEARVAVEEAARGAGRVIDPEHFGALIFYGRKEVPVRLAQLISTRRPGTDPGEVIPLGWDNLRHAIEQFVGAGFSKFVLVPVDEPQDWDRELAEAAVEVLPLQGPR